MSSGKAPRGGASPQPTAAERLDAQATRMFRAGGRANTTFFRAVNFELFAKPKAGQRALAAVGTSAFAAVCVYLVVENWKEARWEAKRREEAVARARRERMQ